MGPKGFSLLSADSPGNRAVPRATRPAKGAGRKTKGAIMGNRAVITTPDRQIGIYLHWNGGRDTVEPLLKYCELKGYRLPSSDSFGWSRLCQVVGNFFGGTLSVGVMPYSDDESMDPGDNGIYVIEGWKIVDRILPYDGFVEQDRYDFDEMLRAFDESMPEEERRGALRAAAEGPASELEEGDEVWVSDLDGHWKHHPVVARTADGTPLVARYDHDGDWEWNPNNHVKAESVLIVPRE